MISAVTQTLAMLLAGETSLTGTEQIDFDHPATRRSVRPRLNLYCYDLRQSCHGQVALQQRVHQANQAQLNNYVRDALKPTGSHRQPLAAELPLVQGSAPRWFDLSFVVSAWDWTDLGEQRLLSEALMLLLKHHRLQEDQLVPTLWGWGNLWIDVSPISMHEMTALWQALGAPLRTALYLTVTAPIPDAGAVAEIEERMLSAVQ